MPSNIQLSTIETLLVNSVEMNCFFSLNGNCERISVYGFLRKAKFDAIRLISNGCDLMIIRFEQYIGDVFLHGRRYSIEEIKEMYKEVKELQVPISNHPEKFCRLFGYELISPEHYLGLKGDVVIDTDIDKIYVPIRPNFHKENDVDLNFREALKNPRKFRGIGFGVSKRVKGSKIDLFRIVKKEIDCWNPFDLLPFAPDDEFFSEAKKIIYMISCESDVEEIAEVVSEVFTNAFFDDEIFTVEKCLGVAQRIFDRLQRRGTNEN